MFLIYIKNFLTKKIVNKSLSNVKLVSTASKIKNVGIVFDESYFYERESLVQELVKQGIEENDIKVLVFRDKIKKNEVILFAPIDSFDKWNSNCSIREKDRSSKHSLDALLQSIVTKRKMVFAF